MASAYQVGHRVGGRRINGEGQIASHGQGPEDESQSAAQNELGKKEHCTDLSLQEPGEAWSLLGAV